MEVKHCFTNYKLFPDPKEPRQPNKETHFYLTNKELNIILSYLNQSYFPFIRLFYHVINLNRIETKKINSTVNKPLTIVNTNDLDTAPEKFIVEEQIKRPVEKQNRIIDSVLEKIDRKEGFEQKNSIVSVRTYINRAIGESLNQALYDLEIQRERFPEKKELFSAKGSIRYVAQYLLNNKS